MSEGLKLCPFCDGTGHVPEKLYETRIILRRWCEERSCVACPLRDTDLCMGKSFDYLINYDETVDILLRHLFGGINPVHVVDAGIKLDDSYWSGLVDLWCARRWCTGCPFHGYGGHGSEENGYCSRPHKRQSHEEAGKKILMHLFGKDILEV